MEKARKLVRQNRLQKYARILGSRYSLKVYLNNFGSVGFTDSTNKIYIKQTIDKNSFKNLVMQKAVILHELGHVLYTDNSIWMQQEIDKSIVNIIEDGRVEERISRRYIKARLYFVYLNQNLIKLDLKEWEEQYLKRTENVVLDAILREAKKRTGIPQLPIRYKAIIMNHIGEDNYKYLMNCTRKAVATENKEELYHLVNDIDTRMNKLFPKNNHFQQRKNVSNTSKDSLVKCGKATQKQKQQKVTDEDLVEEIKKDLEKQAKVAEKNSESKASSKEGKSSSSESTSEMREKLEDGEKEEKGEKTESGENGESFGSLSDGILSEINEKLEKESMDDIKQESDILQANEISADFSNYGEMENPYVINHRRDKHIPTKDLDRKAKKIAQLFRTIASTGDGWQHNQTRGKLEMHKLTTIMSGNSRPRVFKKIDKIKGVDLSACILLDGSGSMNSYGRYTKATKASYIISKALDIGNYKSEVVAFYGQRKLRGIKSFNQKMEYAKKEFIPFYFGGTPLLEALKGAEKSLEQQISKRKMVIVITDGFPNNPKECEKKIREIETKGITVIGILINGDDYGNIFNPRHKIVNRDLEKLPLQMTEVIKKVLLTIRR